MKNRLLSIDIMRGMTIFFMIIVNTPGTWNYVYPPLLHAKWHGWTPTDLVFPFFLFIVGVSMSVSFSKIIVDGSIKQSRGKLIRKILRRTALIFLVGLFLNWFPFHHKHISELRILGVLQRIALAMGELRY
jgi:predicted acyltransferase